MTGSSSNRQLSSGYRREPNKGTLCSKHCLQQLMYTHTRISMRQTSYTSSCGHWAINMCSCNSANDSSNLIQMSSSLLLFSLLTNASLVPRPHPAFRHLFILQATKSWVGPCNEAKPIHQDPGRVLVHIWYFTPRASQTLKRYVLAKHAMVILIIRTKIHVWILWKT